MANPKAVNVDLEKFFMATHHPLREKALEEYDVAERRVNEPAGLREDEAEAKDGGSNNFMVQLHPPPVEPGKVRFTVVPDTDPFLVTRTVCATHFTLHVESEGTLCMVSALCPINSDSVMTPMRQLELPCSLRQARDPDLRDCIPAMWACVRDDTFEGMLTQKQNDALEGYLKILLHLGNSDYITQSIWKAYRTRFENEAEKAAYLMGGLYITPGEDILAGIVEWAMDEMPVCNIVAYRDPKLIYLLTSWLLRTKSHTGRRRWFQMTSRRPKGRKAGRPCILLWRGSH